MNEKLISEVVQRVEAELLRKPPALLLGKRPPEETGFSYVTEGEYSAVVIGSMSAWELLHFPDEQSLNALLEGKPVYLWEGGQDWKRFSSCPNRSLWSKLLSAQRQLQQWGVKPLAAASGKLMTAQEVQRRLKQGLPIEGRLTPLARDLLEGRE
ncbi:MAG: hypothetical protein IJB35_03120 [Oscillospiraceae bacterium]|nr:hypothetical protein [Oscillospiraceae bacterium]